MRSTILSTDQPPTQELIDSLDKDIALMLSYESYGSVRRAMIRRAIEFSDLIPPSRLFSNRPNVTFRGLDEWRRASNLGAVVHNNDPVREAFRLIGGGALNLVREAEKSIRLTGGRGNLARIAFRYADLDYGLREYPFSFSASLLANELFSIGRLGKLQLLKPRALLEEYKMMADTSSGYYYKQHTSYPPKRLGYIVRHRRELAAISQLLSVVRLSPQQQILLPWFMASRGKIIPLKELDEKIQEEKPLARGIMVGEPSEHYLFYALYKPIFRRIIEMMNGPRGSASPIKIGIRKNSDDWPRLKKELSRWTYVMTTDWSGFDATLPPEVLRRAWSVLVAAMDVKDDEDTNYLINLSNLYQHNFVNGVIAHAGFVVAKKGGLPSGSIFTSIIGSVCNYMILKELTRLHPFIDACEVFVYGDDAIIGFETKSRLELKEYRRAFLHQLATLAKTHFGMDLSKTKTEVAPTRDNYYQLVQPRYAEPADLLRRGTRGLKPVGERPADEFNFSVDYENGFTHRARYKTNTAVHFLGKSFDKWGRQIMSTYDTIVRMVNPEHSVTTIADAISRVLEYASDNPHNRLLVNQLKYVYLALHVMQDQVGGGAARWPRALSQKMRATEADLVARSEHMLIDKITALPDGALRLKFRAETEYVDLRSDAYFSGLITKYETELVRRTGWMDVMSDWEALAAYKGKPFRRWIPEETPKRAGPHNERVRDVVGAEFYARQRETYSNIPGNLGNGSPDGIAMMCEKILGDTSLEDRRGFVSGCLLNIWPGGSEFKEKVRADLRELVERAEGISLYASDLKDGEIVWEQDVAISFIGARSAPDAALCAVYDALPTIYPIESEDVRESWDEETIGECRKRIEGVLKEGRGGDTRRTWLCRRKRVNYVLAYLGEMEMMLSNGHDEELKELLRRRFLKLGPENDPEIADTEWREFNDDLREDRRVGVAKEKMESHLFMLRIFIRMGYCDGRKKKKRVTEDMGGVRKRLRIHVVPH